MGRKSLVGAPAKASPSSYIFYYLFIAIPRYCIVVKLLCQDYPTCAGELNRPVISYL